jgi:hypothetical protein
MPGEVKVMRLRHLAREVATALELALVARAPSNLIERLASTTGLLVALEELPLDTEALRIWATETVSRAQRSLSDWRSWDEKRKAVA